MPGEILENIKQVAKNADFVHEWGKGCGKWAAHSHSIFNFKKN